MDKKKILDICKRTLITSFLLMSVGLKILEIDKNIKKISELMEGKK